MVKCSVSANVKGNNAGNIKPITDSNYFIARIYRNQRCVVGVDYIQMNMNEGLVSGGLYCDL